MTILIGCLLLSTMSFTTPNYLGDCELTTFTQLKNVQESDKIDKEDKILELGYSFEKEEERGGYIIRYYGKCNKSYGYNERLSINVTHNSIGYGTYSRDNYLVIKNQVKKIPTCKRRQGGKFDIYEYCSDGHAYLFSVDEVYGRGYYFVDIQN